MSNIVPSDISNNSFSYSPVDFDTAFANFVLIYNNSATSPADTTKGSTIWAVAKATTLMYAEQSLQITGPGGVINIARLATCIGSDADSFVNQFNVFRLLAIGSSGQIRASVPQPLAAEGTLFVGQTIGSNLGDVQFVVIEDTTNPAYSEAAGGYVAPTGALSVLASVVCTSTGYATNVQAGELTVFLSSPLGVANQWSTVTNPLAFTNGKDQESTDALKARFVLEVVGGGTATALACAAQALLASTNLFYAVGDPWNPDTQLATPGYLTIFLGNNGSNSGVLSTTIGTAQANVLSVKAGGIVAQVRAASVTPVSIAMSIVVAAGFNPGAVQTAVQIAISTYLNTIPMSGPVQASTTMPAFYPYAVAFQVPGVQDIRTMTVNGASPADVTAPFGSQLVAGSIVISLTT